jgi:hypothetical protein
MPSTPAFSTARTVPAPGATKAAPSAAPDRSGVSKMAWSALGVRLPQISGCRNRQFSGHAREAPIRNWELSGFRSETRTEINVPNPARSDVIQDIRAVDIGCARASTADQRVDLQHQALSARPGASGSSRGRRLCAPTDDRWGLPEGPPPHAWAASRGRASLRRQDSPCTGVFPLWRSKSEG